MNFDSVPVWVVFFGTILVVMASIGAGHMLGKISNRRPDHEKESPVSGVSGTILGLTAFMLAFTFGIVAERYDARKALVRDDANAIRTTYQRAAFLPEPDRAEARGLLRKYLDLRVAFAQAKSIEPQRVQALLAETDQIQRSLWDIAVVNAERDMDSDVAALYIESLNNVFEINASRVAVGLQARIPIGVWFVLYGLTILGMISIGYHTGLVGSKWSKVTVILALSFAMVIAVIALLDRPGGFVRVTQQPLLDLQSFIAAGE
jgi:hypothetical protein